MGFEKVVPQWNAVGTEPPSALKNGGFEAGYKPPAAYFNWFWYNVSQCLTELQNEAVPHETIAGVSLNTAINTGVYAYNTRCTERPSANSGSLFVCRFQDAYISQLALAHTINRAYVRYSGDGGASWTSWAELAYASETAPNGFGLGDISTDISGKNLITEARQKSGFYRGSNVTNAPNTYWWCYIVAAGSDTADVIAFGMDGEFKTARFDYSDTSIEWNTYADASHTHGFGDISGTLPLNRGGTGATTAIEAAKNLGAYTLLAGTAIPEGADLNDYTNAGNYHCSTNAIARGLGNCPVTNAFTMKAFYANGSNAYVAQELTEYVNGLKHYRVYTRADGTWSEWEHNFTTASPVPTDGIEDGAVTSQYNYQLPTTGWTANVGGTYEADVTISGIKSAWKGITYARRGTKTGGTANGFALNANAFETDAEEISKLLASYISADNTLHLVATEPVTNAVYMILEVHKK